MNVKGNHEFKVSRAQLWTYLMDPEVLAKITPGVSKLEIKGDDAYNTVSDIKIGPVKGSFKGKLNVDEKSEPASFVINMEQLSKIGNAHAKINMRIEETENGNAELFFDGNAKLSGMIARTGQRVLSGVANAITKEVFASLEQHIDEDGTAVPSQAPAIVEKSEKQEVQEIREEEEEEDTVQKPIVTEENIQSANDNTQVSKPTEFLEHKMAEAKEVTTPKTDSIVEDTANTGLLLGIVNFFKSIFKSN